MKKSRTVPLGMAALLMMLAGITAALNPPAQASESGQPTTGAGGLVTYGPPRYPEPLTKLPPGRQKAAHRASALADANKADFLGSYVGKDDRVVIVAKTERGKALARDDLGARDAGTADAAASETTATDDPDVGDGDFSILDAQDLGVLLRSLSPSLADAIYMWGAEPETGGMFITVRLDLTDDDRLLIETFALTNSLPITVELTPGTALPELTEDRQTDLSPYAGGARYARGTASSGGSLIGTCSSGFGYAIGSTQYLLTAGHCYSRGTAYPHMWVVTGTSTITGTQWAGKVFNSSWTTGTGSVKAGAGTNFQYHGDVALVNVTTASRSAGDHIWWGDVNATDKIPVTSRTAPTVGDATCLNGLKSGSDCGTVVRRTNIAWTYSSGDVLRNGDLAHSTATTDCPQGGDSGGSVVVDHSGAETAAEATGIVSGNGFPSTGGCDMLFTGIEEAMQAWGGGLKFS